MSYNLIYFNNIMWLDGVYMLPLVVLGLERIMGKKSSLLYTLALALTLVFNYYIAYMICIFLVLFFAFRMASGAQEKRAGLKEITLRFFKLLAGRGIGGFCASSYGTFSAWNKGGF